MRNLRNMPFVVATLLLTIGVNSSLASASDLNCSHIAPIQMRFLSRHVVYSEMNKNLERRTVDQYIKHLDGSKIYLLQPDITAINKSMTGIFAKTREQDCAPILDAYALLKKRIRENVTFAQGYLGKDFKFDPKTKLVTDPLKRSFAKTQKDAEDYMKKYIQLQVASYMATDVKEDEARQKALKNYDRALKKIDEEGKTPDVLASYLDSFALALDPHSTYWSPDSFEEFEIGIRLSLEGIGATLSSKDGFTVIEQLLPGGAAEKSGQLHAKDMIVAVGQDEKGVFEDVVDQDLRDVVKKIRGKKGTLVRLKILRKGDTGSKTFEIALTRDKIDIADEAAAIHYIDKEFNGKKLKIGLLDLPTFYADSREGERSSAADMKKLLREARDKKIDALVLDLSSNGGGSLQDAVEIAGQFFREGNVVKQSSRDPMNPELVLADKDPLVDWPGPLVVLTSRVTASASEIVSGTLQDYHRAVIVGADHTFGKGTVQAVEPLPQKLGAIKTTIGLYYIPSGESTQHIGVVGDVTLPSVLSVEELGEKNLDYSLPPSHIKPFISAEAYVPTGRGAWQVIDKKIIATLKADSLKRVAKDPEFKKVREDITKSEKHKNGEVVVSDFLKDKEDANKEQKKDEGKNYAETQVAKKERYLKRADIQEVLTIAAELATLEGAGTHVSISAKDATQTDKSAVDPSADDSKNESHN
jgi:carboxyl-terminal processing protease